MSEPTVIPPHARLLLSAFGLGWSPVMPGTAGSLGTAALIYGVSVLVGPAAGFLAAGVLFALGTVVTLRYGGLPTGPAGHGDPGWVVSDEVAGQAIASAVAALVGGPGTHLAAFLLFRIFDITKPGLGRLEAVDGGLGVLLDDLAAGAIAGLLVGAATFASLLPA